MNMQQIQQVMTQFGMSAQQAAQWLQNNVVATSGIDPAGPKAQAAQQGFASELKGAVGADSRTPDQAHSDRYGPPPLGPAYTVPGTPDWQAAHPDGAAAPAAPAAPDPSSATVAGALAPGASGPQAPAQAGPQSAGPTPPAAPGAGTPPATGGSAFSSVPAGAADQARFGLGDSELPGDWGSKVFREGNTSLYDPTVASSPFGQFLLSHYGTRMQAGLTEGLLNGGVGVGQSSDFARQQLAQQAAGGGVGQGGNQISDLSTAANNIAAFAGGQKFSNPGQAAALGGMAGDNGSQATLVRQGTAGLGGGLGQHYVDSLLNGMYSHSLNDPASMAPGTFAQAALKQLGIGQ